MGGGPGTPGPPPIGIESGHLAGCKAAQRSDVFKEEQMSLVEDPLCPRIDSRFTGGQTNSLSEFSAMVSQLYSPVRVQADKPERFQGKIRSRNLGEVHFNEVKTTQHLIELAGKGSLEDTRRFLKVSLLLKGHGSSLKGSTRTEFGPGDMIIHDSSQPYTMHLDDDFHMAFLLVPRERFDLPESAMNELLGQSIDSSACVSRAVVPFFSALASNISSLSGPSAVRLMGNTVDLLETMMFSVLAQPLNQPHRDRRRELLLQLHGYIDEHLDDPDLDPLTIATANYISVRYLHRLFHEEDTTVASYLRQARLSRCRRDLTDPLLTHLPVSAIASRWGFTNSSHFSRLFRQEVGATPTEYRFNALLTRD